MADLPCPTIVVAKPRRGLSRVDAALYIGVSPSMFDQLVKQGTMPKPLHLGARVVWDIRALDAAFEALRGDDEVDTWADA